MGEMVFVGLGAAALIGVSLGVMGAGGSILAVPVFIYLLGFGVKEAVASSLVMVGLTSLLGSWAYLRRGFINTKLALSFGLLTMAGAFAGAHLARFMSGPEQMLLFSLVMLAAAVMMLVRDAARGGGGSDGADAPGGLRRVIVLAPLGFAVGVLTGLVGVGGGFLIVPVLVLAARMSMKEAAGTSLLVIFLNSAAAFAGYLGQVSLDWPLLAAFVAVAVAGSLAGARLASALPERGLQRGLALFLIGLSSVILYQNFGPLLHHFQAFLYLHEYVVI
ncbi:MAG: sulfite exporter TauE/SafE family protein [Rubrobacteraceae bacterium]|nr:sulfite exporter TauE/SafE family protein [Rubrobacteraceae bacterium]